MPRSLRRSLEKAKVLRIRHRLATVFALCLVSLLALDYSVRAGDGKATTRAELVEQLEGVVEAGLGASSLKIESVRGLIGVHFDTTLVAALRTLADGASRPVYLHPDVDLSREVEMTVAGTQEEVIRAVAEHAGLAASVNPTGFVVAEDRLLADPDWIDRAVVLSGVPNRRVRLDIDLEVDGEAIPTPVLIVGLSNWTGFEAGRCRINIVARRINDEGVDLELGQFSSVGNGTGWEKEMPYGMRRTLIDGRIPGRDGDSCRVSLLASAYELDGNRYPDGGDGERPNANVKAPPKENGDDAGTKPNGG